MDLVGLIDALSKPSAYPHPVDRVDVWQTHISVVFLAGEFAYKIKKPVDLGFLDFTTLAKRRTDCEEEVRLNRRLAPLVYHGIVPITEGSGGLRIAGGGPVVEWAVKMERLPETASLLDQLNRGAVAVPLIERIAKRIASFHSDAERGARIADFGRFNVVAGNARENFDQALSRVGDTVSPTVFDRLRLRTEESLARLRPLIDDRAGRGVPCDTHGDLHLDHVYYLADRAPPNDLIAIDCIEFNERFRFADPMADVAFLAMDLHFHGRSELAEALVEAYIRATGDAEGRALLPFYTSYRAAVRGKVEGMQAGEAEIPEPVRTDAHTRARAHWLLALSLIEPAIRRPALILIGGLPGTGKSTLARALAERANFTVIRSDVVRKQLAGLTPDTRAPAEFNRGLYSPEMTARTYAESYHRATENLFNGMRVIVDAQFGMEVDRHRFLDAAAELRIPALLLVCRTDAEEARKRIENRHDDASDADVSIYRLAAERWQEPRPYRHATIREVDTTGDPAQALAQAIRWLEAGHLLD
jgi:aminoglycoside phosphotransferase family enzyme/predicted kinase